MALTARRRPRLPLYAVLSAVFVAASPLVALGAALGHHAVSFTGTCGPYAPDISAHPCGFETWVANFFSPFAVMGMLMLTPVVWLAAAIGVAVAWGVAFAVRALRRR